MTGEREIPWIDCGYRFHFDNECVSCAGDHAGVKAEVVADEIDLSMERCMQVCVVLDFESGRK